MKRLPALYSALFLIGPILIIAALMAGPFGCGGGGGGGATPVPAMGSVEVGFVDSPSQPFQALALNIVSVRLNPSTDPTVDDTDPNWQTITAPPGAGPGELSVNLLELQNNAMIFNIGQIPAQVYNQVEVVIDASIPGVVIPSCLTSLAPTLEGCINAQAVFSSSTNLRFTAPGGINVTAGALSPLIIDINPGTITSPASSGGNYTMNPNIAGVPTGSFLGVITGTVTGATSTSGNKVNAELTGTNSLVATAPVQSNGAYTIQLPGPPLGSTSYDLFVSGTGTTFAVASPIVVARGGPGPITENFSVVAGAAPGTIAGQVIDARTGGGLVGATVNLLLPESAADNCAVSLAGCVVVATTTSDSAASYTFTEPVPPSGTQYFIQASMTGTSTAVLPVSFASTSTCPGPDPSNCSISLPNVLLNGTVVVDPPPAAGSNITVTVMAELHGTGTLVGLSQVTVSPIGSAPFSMEVPTTPAGPPFVDLIASANDSFEGIGTQFSGHSLATVFAVNPATPPPGGVTLTVSCLGHGTISGTAPFSDANTHVRLFLGGVQLMDTTVGNAVPVPGASATPAFPNQYSFCAPPASGPYVIQRFEVTGPVASPGPTQSIVVPMPAPTATSPCPLCENVAGQCPGNCAATVASPLP